jgi:hypothetical protein
MPTIIGGMIISIVGVVMIKEGFEVYYTGRLPAIIFDKYYSSPSDHKVAKKTNDMNEYYSLNKKILETLRDDNKKIGTNNIIVEMENLPDSYSSLLSSIDIPRIFLYEDLNKYKSEDLLFWRASGIMGHWNNYAHTIVGKSLANKMYLMVNNELNTSNPGSN